MNYKKNQNAKPTTVRLRGDDLRFLKKHKINISVLIRDLVRDWCLSNKGSNRDLGKSKVF